MDYDGLHRFFSRSHTQHFSSSRAQIRSWNCQPHLPRRTFALRRRKFESFHWKDLQIPFKPPQRGLWSSCRDARNLTQVRPWKGLDLNLSSTKYLFWFPERAMNWEFRPSPERCLSPESLSLQKKVEFSLSLWSWISLGSILLHWWFRTSPKSWDSWRINRKLGRTPWICCWLCSRTNWVELKTRMVEWMSQLPCSLTWTGEAFFGWNAGTCCWFNYFRLGF